MNEQGQSVFRSEAIDRDRQMAYDNDITKCNFVFIKHVDVLEKINDLKVTSNASQRSNIERSLIAQRN